MTTEKYFTTTKRGEIYDLQQELVSNKEAVRKDAVKKVIAAMTVGKDVSMLFTDVLKCIHTSNLELKKLVYLYIINHARLQPDRAILAVNTFQNDASSENPLVRALAIRTMGCIRVDKVTEYLCDPLRKALKDKDPYVRKTAAICVAKLYDMSPELVESQGFVELLVGLLSDSNPTVVANAVAALTEMDELSPKPLFRVDAANLQRLQVALNECTEWGQVYILNSIAKYKPTSIKEAEEICERVQSRLNHSNSAVVLNAIKTIMMCLEYVSAQNDVRPQDDSSELVKTYCRKMAPPLVTLLTTKEPEIQYVALRNINLIVQRRPGVLSHELRIFFIKYNDPIYVKMEKLEILIMLANERNIEQLLNEFKEAASEIDVEFVRKSVRAIGRCAIKIPIAAERCIQVLLDLIATKVNYVVQEAIVVIKDIFRKYPNKYESIIGTLCANLDTLDEPEAKASMIWIIGEYAERIDNADQLLDSFMESFQDETAAVQLQLLTAVVKLFLKRPNDTQEMVQKVLNLSTQETDNPDLRDRGYVYWRLLSTDPDAAKAVVLGEKPLISDDSSALDNALLGTLVANISTLSSVYHRPPEAFVIKLRDIKRERSAYDDDDDAEVVRPGLDDGPVQEAPSGGVGAGNLLMMDDDIPSPASGGAAAGAGAGAAAANVLDDDMFGLGTFTPKGAGGNTAPPAPKSLVLPADKGAGMSLQATFSRRNNAPSFDMTVVNHSPAALSGFALQFNKNSFALSPGAVTVSQVNPSQSAEALVPCTINPAMYPPQGTPITNQIQIAIKNNVGVYYFAVAVPLHALFKSGDAVSAEQFAQLWAGAEHEAKAQLKTNVSGAALQGRLVGAGYSAAGSRSVNGQDVQAFHAQLHNSPVILVQLIATAGQVLVAIKSKHADLLPLAHASLQTILG